MLGFSHLACVLCFPTQSGKAIVGSAQRKLPFSDSQALTERAMSNVPSFFVVGSTVYRLRQTFLSQRLGSSSVTFEAGATEQGQSSRRTMLDEVSSTPTSTIVVAHLGFNTNGRPSSLVDAGTTQIRLSSTSTGEVSGRVLDATG